jgi:hypothetical protein
MLSDLLLKSCPTIHRKQSLSTSNHNPECGMPRELKSPRGEPMKPIVALAVVLGSAIAAPSAQQAPAPASEPAHKVFVLNGCLTGSPAPTAPFKLTGAVAVGQPPQAKPAVGPDAKDVYELVPISGITEQGLDRKELQTHVGKKVEVTVRPVEVQPDSAPSTSSPAPSTAKPAEPTPVRYTVNKISPTGPC